MDSVYPSPAKLRGDAKVALAEKWANRRKQQEEARGNLLDSTLRNDAVSTITTTTAASTTTGTKTTPMAMTTTTKSTSTASTTKVAPHAPIPPLCVLLRRSWKDTLKGFNQHLNSTSNHNRRIVHAAGQIPPSPPPPLPPLKEPRPANQSKRPTFPSVLNILQTTALERQVESFEEARNHGGGGGEQDALSVLPADYDFQKAVQTMTQTRSRAFLLLDLAAIVQSHTTWRRQLPKRGVRMVYSTRHNTNGRLLQLFQRMGVGLRVSTQYDLDVVRQVCRFDDDTDVVWDDCTRLFKPSSFYRRLILGDASIDDDDDDDDDDDEDKSSTTPMTIDGPQEMERIHSQLLAIWKRRKFDQQDMPKLSFLLSLDNMDQSDWNERLMAVHEKAQEMNADLVGVTMELLQDVAAVADDAAAASSSDETTTTTDLSLVLKSLTDLLQSATAAGILIQPQVHLTNPVDAATIDERVLGWMKQHAVTKCSLITIDVSRLLVVNAAALCARIIGVKQAEHGRIHYYIDDGRYGLLSNYPNVGQPLPLKQVQVPTNGSLSSTAEEGPAPVDVPATVWGPTCDGLDKVCSDIVLPVLSRDDWLVFADLGFCHVGTSFNGFSPPDIACCVLGSRV